MADVQTNWILNLAGNIASRLKGVRGQIKTLTSVTQSANNQFKILPGSVNDLRQRLQQLERARDASFRTDHIRKYGKMIEHVKGQIESLTDSHQNLKKSGNLQDKITAMRHFSDMAGELGRSYMESMQTGLQFEHSMKELQAIAGQSDQEADAIGSNARKLAKTYGLDAAQSVESFKLVLSQLTPEIAKQPEALKLMGKHAAVLSKQLDGDTAGAMTLLTTAMNQFGISTKDPMKAQEEMARMMDIMSKAAQDGSAELPQIKNAIEVVGGTAKESGLSFGQLNAAIQVVDKFASKKGSEGGTVIRNVLNAMNSLAIKSPKIIKSLTEDYGVNIAKVTDPTVDWIERLKELKKAGGDTNLMLKIFDSYTKDSAISLMKNTEELEKHTKASLNASGTSEAMAKQIMKSRKEGLARIGAWFDDLKISVFGAIGSFTPFIQFGTQSIQTLGQLGGVVTGVASLKQIKLGGALKKTTGKMLGFVKSIAGKVIPALLSLKTVTLSTLVPSIITGAKTIGIAIMNIPIIGWIAAAISALIGLGVYFYSTSEKFRGFLWGLWEAVKDIGSRIWNFLGGIGNILLGVFTLDIDTIKAGLAQKMSAFSGMGKSVGEAYAKGSEEGIKDFRKSKESAGKEKTAGNYTKEPTKTASDSLLKKTNLFDKKTNLYGNRSGSAGSTGSAFAGNSNSSSAARNIKLNFTINQTFTIDENVKMSLDKIKKAVVDVLRSAADDVVIQSA